MASYKIDWKSSVEHDFKKIDRQYIPKIIKEAENLSLNPFPPDVQKLHDSQDSYRKRVGDYRIIYQVDQKQKVLIINAVRHRKNAYRKR